MTSLFASYVTGSAFRIDLSTRMVGALLLAAEGKQTVTGHLGVDGLIKRGLVEQIEGQDRLFNKAVRLTDAGTKVAELCLMAGLGKK